MKKNRIVQTVLLVAVTVLLASCSAGRQSSYAEPYPSRTNLSLVLHTSPGMVTHRYPDGRYYYRNPYGYTYWRGYDNRYYLDRSNLDRVHYNRHQYNAWKQGHKKYYRKNHRR